MVRFCIVFLQIYEKIYISLASENKDVHMILLVSITFAHMALFRGLVNFCKQNVSTQNIKQNKTDPYFRF